MNGEKFQKTLRVLVNNINQSETDSLKMRYILNFFDKVYSKGYMDDGFQAVSHVLSGAEPEILSERDAQMYRVLMYYLSLKRNEFLPNPVAPAVIYDLPNHPHNIELASRNIFVCDDSFRVIRS